MRDDESPGRQLAAVADVVEVALRQNAPVWLRGGWATDFFLGEVTRPHVDVDWFAWASDLPGLTAALLAQGWVDRAEHPADQQVDLERDGVELGFAALARDSAGRVVVAGGPWAGSPWPEGMLEHAVEAHLGGVTATVIDPRAQIEIKMMTPVWIPGRPRRPKDAADVARLTAALGL